MSSSTDNDAEKLTQQIEGLSIENDIGVKIVTCAACGKEGEEDSMNICNKCKMVHYCNVACKKKHKSKHKKKCDRQCKIRAAELYDDTLFKEPSPREECPICFLPLPIDARESFFNLCCGKHICDGCMHAMAIEDIKKGKDKLEEHLCAFCRTPATSSDDERNRMLEKLVDNGNADAYNRLAVCYSHGTNGMPQDHHKANELFLTAGELGCAKAYFKLGALYAIGQGVEANKKKAEHYWELAAMKGNVEARHFLGCMEGQAGSYQRAHKHFIIAAKAGYNKSLDAVKLGFMDGLVSKDEFEKTLRAYHERQAEMKSEARDTAADFAHSEEH